MQWRRREICFKLALLRSMLKRSSVTIAAAVRGKPSLPTVLARLWPIASAAQVMKGISPVTSMGRMLGHGLRAHVHTPHNVPSTVSITDTGGSVTSASMPSIMRELLLLVVNYSASGKHAVQSLLLSDSTTVRVVVNALRLAQCFCSGPLSLTCSFIALLLSPFLLTCLAC